MCVGHTFAHTQKMVKMEKQSLACGKAVKRGAGRKRMNPIMEKKADFCVSNMMMGER